MASPNRDTLSRFTRGTLSITTNALAGKIAKLRERQEIASRMARAAIFDWREISEGTPKGSTRKQWEGCW